ncbi:haloacid dehalogenase type II [Effusibacillus dendaii]|uniref:Haloacid dehalogenase n=1 Tax=Effusibacillus dendaii TaxID=2743772 RepID=A0A7I8D6N3_9BACL|nr:haloacid dehalogenase type II [Effusibacillus dendaii]BCJ85032.1 haloacid dehalogenase [Effusibacillus dendaii]
MQNIKAIVFDAYGTLFDVHTVVEKCEQYFPTQGKVISQIWRQKQLEYTWLRSLMGRYEDFWHVTSDALTFTLKELGLETNDDICTDILKEYLYLKPYPEVPYALNELKNHTLAILSNGSLEMLNDMVQNAGLREVFSNVISVDELKIFKPFMGVYQLAPAKLGIRKEETLFISSNSWDATGAKVFGFQVCWINRFNKTFDELNTRPDLIIKSLDELVTYIR